MANNKDFKVNSGIQPTVYLEGLGTVSTGVGDGFSLAGASYDNKSFNLTTPRPFGIDISADGTKIFVADDDNTSRTITEYSLSTPFDASTASFDSYHTFSSQTSNPYDVVFGNNGTRMYIMGQTSEMYQYNLSTAYDPSTASYQGAYQGGGQDTSMRSIDFNANGTKMYLTSIGTDTVYEYTTSTPWQVTSGVGYVRSYTFSSGGIPTGNTYKFKLSDDDTKGFVVLPDSQTVYEFNFGTAGDVSTLTYSGNSINVGMYEHFGICFGDDGKKMYAVNFVNDAVYQYSTAAHASNLDLSTGSVFEYTPTTDTKIGITNPAASGTVSSATLLLTGAGTTEYDFSSVVNTDADFVSPNPTTWDTTDLDFNADGTKLYVLYYGERRVRQFSLSTAWDISTATYDNKEFYINEDTLCDAFTLADDGNRMYVVGRSNDRIYLYNLSTAYDISTASYSNNFLSTSGQSSNSYGIRVSSDGSRLILSLGSAIIDGSFGTSWLPSTVTFGTTQLTNVRYFDVSPDGLTLYALDIGTYNITEYTLGSSYNTTSTTATGNSVNAQTLMGTTSLHGVRFGDSGKYLYIGSQSLEVISRFSSSAAATITYESNIKWPGGTAPTSPSIGETDIITFSTDDGGTTVKANIAIDGAK